VLCVWLWRTRLGRLIQLISDDPQGQAERVEPREYPRAPASLVLA